MYPRKGVVKMKMLNIVRKMNKLVGCNQAGCISIEKKLKSNKVYNYLEIPEQCFSKRKASRALQIY